MYREWRPVGKLPGSAVGRGVRPDVEVELFGPHHKVPGVSNLARVCRLIVNEIKVKCGIAFI
eukprot:scaffold6320_cov169-Amphora_coffeaeformis.AAC.1